MRTLEQQKKLLMTAKTYAKYDVSRAIEASQLSETDKETMIGILYTTYPEDSWSRFCQADDSLKEYLLDIFEKTYYGKVEKTDEAEKQRLRITYKVNGMNFDAVSTTIAGAYEYIKAIVDANALLFSDRESALSEYTDVLSRFRERAITTYENHVFKIERV